MATTRELSSPPGTLGAYARAIAPLVPLASRLPFVPGGGGAMPDTELVLGDVAIDRAHLADYAKACGFGLGDTLPATYPHVLAFPLHMALMTDGRFPFGAVGLVHVANAITQHRPVGAGERLELRVRATPAEAHPRGRQFAIVSEARVDGELVWEDVSTMLRRGGGSGDAKADPPRGRGAAPPEGGAEWRLPGDLGRRYASVSGDRNPIHLSGPTAKLLGFPRAIAHGMWTKARSLAALENRLPDAFTADVRFRKPILLPGRVAFSDTPELRFAVRDAQTGAPHLEGAVTKPKTRRTTS
jgi:acyl dehydratase